MIIEGKREENKSIIIVVEFLKIGKHLIAIVVAKNVCVIVDKLLIYIYLTTLEQCN